MKADCERRAARCHRHICPCPCVECDAPRSPAAALGEPPQLVRFTPARRKSELCLCNSLLADDYLFILVLIGDSGVGKSCLLLRFAVRFCLPRKVTAPGALLFWG